MVGEDECFNAMIIGDEFVNTFDTKGINPVWDYLYRFRKFSEAGCNLAKAMELLDSNMSKHVRLVVIHALHYELAKKVDGIHMIRDDQGAKLGEAVVKASTELKKKYPCITFIWTVPISFPFEHLNNEEFENNPVDTQKRWKVLYDSKDYYTLYANRSKILDSKLRANKLETLGLIIDHRKNHVMLTKKLYQRVYALYGE